MVGSSGRPDVAGLPGGLWAQLESFAIHRVPVLIIGETGTGKSRMAGDIHKILCRRGSPNAPYVAVNMAAVPKGLAEAELFGCHAGAYTGADVDRLGSFHRADGGVLFLDELHRMKRSAQAKLLVALDAVRGVPGADSSSLPTDSPEGTFRVTPLGTPNPKARGDADTRERLARTVVRTLLVCATTSPQDIEVELLSRVAGFTVHLRPLRERRDGILKLTHRYLRESWEQSTLRQAVLSGLEVGATGQLVEAVGRLIDARRAAGTLVSDEARAWLTAADRRWPGNLRQLQALVNRAFLLSSGAARRGPDPVLTAELLQHASSFDVHEILARPAEAPSSPPGARRTGILSEWMRGADLVGALEEAPSPFHVGAYERALVEEFARQVRVQGLTGRVPPRQVVNAFGIRARAEDLPAAHAELADVLAPLRRRERPAS